jgi:hypothetical protein
MEGVSVKHGDDLHQQGELMYTYEKKAGILLTQEGEVMHRHDAAHSSLDALYVSIHTEADSLSPLYAFLGVPSPPLSMLTISYETPINNLKYETLCFYIHQLLPFVQVKQCPLSSSGLTLLFVDLNLACKISLYA